MKDVALLQNFCHRTNINCGQTHLEKLALYHDLLLKWSQRFNLIGRGTQENIYQRHFLDSLQLVPAIYSKEHILDIGSGAGFPGIILSIFTSAKIFVCDIDKNKSVFMRQVKRDLQLNHLTVLNEDVTSLDESFHRYFDTITSRAYGSVGLIQQVSEQYLKKSGRYILLKGNLENEEIDNQVTKSAKTSITSNSGKIIITRYQEVANIWKKYAE